MLTITHDRTVDKEVIAGRTDLPVLITAFSRRDIERIARRIHLAGPRAAAPFVQLQVGALPARPDTIRKRCTATFDRATGGTLLLAVAEDMSPSVQDTLIALLDEHRSTLSRTVAARLLTGTTVSLIERVVAGLFSERLFYQLSLIHVVAPGPSFATGHAHRARPELAH